MKSPSDLPQPGMSRDTVALLNKAACAGEPGIPTRVRVRVRVPMPGLVCAKSAAQISA